MAYLTSTSTDTCPSPTQLPLRARARQREGDIQTKLLIPAPYRLSRDLSRSFLPPSPLLPTPRPISHSGFVTFWLSLIHFLQQDPSHTSIPLRGREQQTNKYAPYPVTPDIASPSKGSTNVCLAPTCFAGREIGAEGTLQRVQGPPRSTLVVPVVPVPHESSINVGQKRSRGIGHRHIILTLKVAGCQRTTTPRNPRHCSALRTSHVHFVAPKKAKKKTADEIHDGNHFPSTVCPSRWSETAEPHEHQE